MEILTSYETAALFLALGILLAVARLFGELARRFNYPSVLGEILAGILLGPTLLGALTPDLFNWLFPSQGGHALVFNALMTLAITLFLLVAGLEVTLSTVWRQGKTILTVGAAGIIVPFALGFAAGWILPGLMGRESGADPLIFALFMATALSISALPVIAKTLMDLDLYRSDLGMIVVAAAVFNDLAGWIIFAVILGMLGTSDGHFLNIGQTIGLTLAFTAVMLTAGRWLINRVLPWIHAHAGWPGGVLGFSLALGLISASITEWLGVHAIFGAFLAGVALGDSPHLRARTRTVIEQFVSFIFAPLFFASIGLHVDFIRHFDLKLTAMVLVISCAGKILGAGLGARLCRIPPREAWAIGLAMNARGAMEIILGLLALRFGIINERLFVALVIMAVVTSLMSGPFMQRLLRVKKPRRFFDFLSQKAFQPNLQASGREEAIRELAEMTGTATGLDPQTLTAAALGRERIMATGIGHGVAVPQARIDELSLPVVGVGISNAGIDFDAPDGLPARLIFLVLTPTADEGVQLEILADIARTFRDPHMRTQALQTTCLTELLALIKSGAEREESV
jgi:Kef-type K+ transport system membrane component KefB/mannitol/fructose-specific phosphotransferase system IIA component